MDESVGWFDPGNYLLLILIFIVVPGLELVYSYKSKIY